MANHRIETLADLRSRMGEPHPLTPAKVIDKLGDAERSFIARSPFHCAKAFLRAELWKPETWPERQRISFGKQLVERAGQDAKLAPLIDAQVEQDYEKGL